MSLLSRYVLREVTQVFLVSLFVLTTLIILGGVGKEAYNEGLTAMAILRLMPYLLPTALLFAVPTALLFSITISFGRMSAAGEIIALKALGISPSVVLMPIGVLAVLLSLVTFCLNDIAFSWGEIGMRRIVVESFEEIAYSVLRKKGSYSSPYFSVVVRSVEGHRLIDATFTFKESAGSAPMTLHAEEAELRSNPGTGVLTLSVQNWSVERAGQSNLEFTGSTDREIQLADLSADPYAKAGASRVPLRVLPQRIIDQQALIDRLEQETAAQVGWRLVSGDFVRLGTEVGEQTNRLKDAHKELAKMRTEPWRRWANGFSCLVFAMVGMPVAILRRFSDAWASFFVCFMPILVIYYPLMMYGVDRAKVGALPPFTVWLANAVLAVWGLWLLRRVYRY